jgi:Kef-type K+ transport system membrane component KefB/voltage-gated potassium channel Kch
MHGESILIDIGLALLAATALAYVARFLRQPLLLAYIGAGLLIGPTGFGLIHNQQLIGELSGLGLAFLMFIVGLEIDLKKLVHSSRVVGVVGAVQVIACSALAVGAMYLLGYRGLPMLYLGVASAFSSTMIVVKLLSDRSELDTVDGRLTLGILLVQDALAIVVLALQPNLSQPSLAPLLLSLLGGLALVGGALALARYALPPLFRWAAKSPEIVLISAISWCLLISYLATLAGFSEAMGALIAGVTLSALPYTLDVVAKISSLRDFFVTLFFVSLGLQLELGSAEVLLTALALSAVVLTSRFLSVGPLLHNLGYGPRVGLLSSIALSQEGEFALVIVSIGLALGHIGREIVSITALTLVITATVSTYMMMANHALAGRAAELLQRLGLAEPPGAPVDGTGDGEHADVVLVGFHRVASSLLHFGRVHSSLPPFLIVDFSPEVYERMRVMGVPVRYGDISHLDTLAHAGVEGAKVVVSTVSEDFLRGTDNIALLKQVKRLNPAARVILSAETLARARAMYEAGADYVVLPRVETAQAFAEVLAALGRGELDEMRARAVADLASRDEVLA